MASTYFLEIKRIVIQENLNQFGFTVGNIRKRIDLNNFKISTLKTFIPKHARINTIYFERIGVKGSGLYRIRYDFIQ